MKAKPFVPLKKSDSESMVVSTPNVTAFQPANMPFKSHAKATEPILDMIKKQLDEQNKENINSLNLGPSQAQAAQNVRTSNSSNQGATKIPYTYTISDLLKIYEVMMFWK